MRGESASELYTSARMKAPKARVRMKWTRDAIVKLQRSRSCGMLLTLVIRKSTA